jgi:hypothetical protein
MNDLVRYDSIKDALVKAQSFDELLTIKDAARRMEEAGRRARDTSMIEAATELQVLYKRYLGKMLAEMPKAPSGRKANRSSNTTDLSAPATLKEIGVSKDESAMAQRLYSIPEEKFGSVVAAAKAKDHKVSVAAVLRAVAPKAEPKPPAPPKPPVVIEEVSKECPNCRKLESRLSELDSALRAYSEVCESDDKVSSALKEIRRLTELNRILEERNNGLLGEKNAAIKQAKYWEKKAVAK